MRDPSNKRLLDDASKASKSAYAPYSGYHVGAAVETESGQIFFGCNVENVSYSITVCAERSAIAAAVLAEGPKMRIRRIAVAAKDKRGRLRPCTPCGACRQCIAEFGPGAKVVFINGNRGLSSRPIARLLPGSFSEKELTG